MNSRHILINGVVLNGKPDFLQTTEKFIKNGTENLEFDIKTNEETIKTLIKKLNVLQILEVEFLSIPLKRISAGISTSQLLENQIKNHPKSIMPYEDTRIMLHPTRKNKHGYINASNIQIPINERLFKYILTQTPLKTTIEDFYQMIWESGTRIVIAFTTEKNNDHDILPIYWPTKINEKISIGDYSVRQQSSTITKGLTTTILNIKFLSSGEKRIIYHLNFTAFRKDLDGVPVNIETFLSKFLYKKCLRCADGITDARFFETTVMTDARFFIYVATFTFIQLLIFFHLRFC